MRNDLSQVARNVRVERFRFIDEIKTNGKHLLQVSSEITGDLPDNWKNKMGDILKIITRWIDQRRSEKKKTVEIIEMAEKNQEDFIPVLLGFLMGKNWTAAWQSVL
ncbi:MAG: hypothetical protein R2825_09570 [Saprospiraceae bacterium]